MDVNNNILFVANVQGPALIEARGISRNLSIAGNAKVFGICEALSSHGQVMGVYSPGTTAERTGRWHSKMIEEVGPNRVPVLYGATVDNRVLRIVAEGVELVRLLPNIIKRREVGIVVVYNLSLITLLASVIAKYCGCKLILEYEDSALASRTKRPPLWKRTFRLQEWLMGRWSFGVYAPSSELLDSLGSENRLLLPGVLGSTLVGASIGSEHWKSAVEDPAEFTLKMLYSGGLDESKGIDRFLAAAEYIETSIEIHICGKGPLAESLREKCEQSRHKAIFHGLVEQRQLVDLQTSCHVGLNPHRSDLHGGGAWPFKVVEYLAGCGTVFCSRSGKIPEDLAGRLFLYDGNSVEAMATALDALITQWPELYEGAAARRHWAIAHFGPTGIAKKLELLLEGDVPNEWKGL